MFSTPGNKALESGNSLLFHMDDIAPEFANESNLGRKGTSLFALHSFDVPVPEFFILSPQIFSDFVKKVLDEKGDELLSKGNPDTRDILNAFHRFDFDNSLKSEILKEYTKLSGFSDAWVSVRSSVCAVGYPEVSFSGVFSTELNIRGFNNLLKSIKSIYASMFTDSAVMYAVREGVELADVKLSVIVQKMVHAEISGTCFTLDPVTLNPDRMSIEAVYGLGDVIANGELTPDSYYLIKKNLEVYEKHISPQDWMRVRSLSNTSGGFEKISISPSWSHRQKLEDKYIQEVAKISLLIEDKKNDHVDVEWVLAGGKVYVLQYKHAYTKQSYLTHHVQYGGYSYVANSVGQVLTELIGRKNQAKEMIENSMQEAQKLVMQANTAVPREEKVEEPIQIVKEELPIQALISGIGVSFGKSKGIVHILKDPLDSVSKKNILLIDEYNSSFASSILKSSGVIAVNGGLTSDVAILCREFGIPAIVGVTTALEVIHEGDEIELDGNSGSIYMIDQAKVEEITVAKEIISKNIEFITAKPESKMEKGQSPAQTMVNNVHTATKLYSDSQNMRYEQGSDGMVFIDLDQVMINFGKHPTEVLEDGKYKKYAEEIVVPIVKIAQEYSPNEVVIVIGKGTTDEFNKIAKRKDTESMEDRYATNGVARYLKNKKSLEVAVRLVKRLRNVNHCRNISLGVYAPQSGIFMKEIKKEISARGLRRGSSFNIFAVIENPSEVILCEDILDAEIDGIIVDTTTLAKRVFNLPLNHKDVVYDLGAGSILKILDSVSSSVRKMGKKLIVTCEDNKDILKYSVNKGAYGVIVSPDYLYNARKIVAEQEAKIILSVK